MESELQNPTFHILVDEIVLDKERFTMADLNELESQAEQYRAEGKVKEEIESWKAILSEDESFVRAHLGGLLQGAKF